MLLESIAGWLGHALSDDVRQHVAHSLDSIFVAFEALVEGAVRSAQQRIAGSLYDAPDLALHKKQKKTCASGSRLTSAEDSSPPW